jgi:hypothetical protein
MSRWHGLTLNERKTIFNRWHRRRQNQSAFTYLDIEAIIKATEHAILSKIVRGDLIVVTPED